MRLQRYPDGAWRWSLSIWGRHPRSSLTWTHSLSLSRYRASSGVTLWPRLSRTPRFSKHSQWGWRVRALRFELTLLRQEAMPRVAT